MPERASDAETGLAGSGFAELQVRGPERAARVMLTAAVAAMGYLDYFQYKRAGLDEGAWEALAAGHGTAPDQYRVSVVLAARWLGGHLHGRLSLAMCLIDIASALVAVHLLWNVFTRTAVYRNADKELRWVGAAAFVLLPPWYFGWIFWLSKPETLPAVMLLAVMLWLWQPPVHAEQPKPWLRIAGLLVATLLLSLMRADEACLMNFGMALACWVRASGAGDRGVALPRKTAISVAVILALVAGMVQFWLMRIVFPQAHYGHIKFWQLWPNLHHASRWPPLATFCLPAGWAAVQAVRRRFAGDVAGVGTLYAAMLFFGLWTTIGKFDEVRVFLPFALTLAPLIAEMLMLRVKEQGSGSRIREDA